jgi:hypothetical protein
MKFEIEFVMFLSGYDKDTIIKIYKDWTNTSKIRGGGNDQCKDTGPWCFGCNIENCKLLK